MEESNPSGVGGGRRELFIRPQKEFSQKHLSLKLSYSWRIAARGYQ